MKSMSDGRGGCTAEHGNGSNMGLSESGRLSGGVDWRAEPQFAPSHWWYWA